MKRIMKQKWKSLLATTLLLFAVTSLFAVEEVTDQNITNAVGYELMYNSTVPAYRIDVNTENGIVTLSGTVSNLLAEDRAVKIARTVKGVKAVIDNIKVDTPYRSDMTLKNEVTDALLEDPATDSYEIGVEANDGTLTLTGTVNSWQEKQLAEFVAKGVEGVKKIQNDINIHYDLRRSDQDIKADIVQSLKNDVRIDQALLNVNVNNGNVILSGTVGSANELSLAVSESWVMGVQSVKADDVDVKEWARNKDLRENKYVAKTDKQLKDAINHAFLYDPRVLEFNPEVTVTNGIVSLTGEVDNLKAKRAAGQDAKNVVGVVMVNNYLKVRPTFIPEDNKLAANVENALKKDPLISKKEINVTANNGLVYLNGTVDNNFEKMQAENVASKTKGVLAVENNLKVNNENDQYFTSYYGWNSFFPPAQVRSTSHYQTDKEIKNQIESQLWWSPYVNKDEVNVTVTNGVATLTGTVETKREKLMAQINALEGGAKDVNNDLIVKYKP